MDQGSTMKQSAVHNFAPTVTKFCVMWEGQALPHDTKFGNSRCEIVGRRVIFIWSLIHGLRWSGLIKAEPDVSLNNPDYIYQYHVWGMGMGKSLHPYKTERYKLSPKSWHHHWFSIWAQVLSQLGHGWVIICHTKQWMTLIIHVLVSVNLYWQMGIYSWDLKLTQVVVYLELTGRM